MFLNLKASLNYEMFKDLFGSDTRCDLHNNKAWYTYGHGDSAIKNGVAGTTRNVFTNKACTGNTCSSISFEGE
jgi:hypothetical protein